MPQRGNDAQNDAQRAAEQDTADSTQTQDETVDAATQWFATTALRGGLTLIGVVLLLFALGQAVGLPLLELVTSALTSQTGQWLVVAFFAILLIGAAQKAVPTG
jgi:hypothetical protein